MDAALRNALLGEGTSTLLLYVAPFAIGAFLIGCGWFFFLKSKFLLAVVLAITGALFVLAPFPWWVFFVFWAVVALWWWRRMASFARDRKAVMEQTGEKWYRFASEEIYSDHGQQFLLTHFAETLLPDRAPTWNRRMLARVAALGAYLRLIEQKGNDPTQYTTLPVDDDAVRQARVLSRVAIPSTLYGDHPLITSL